MIFSKNGAGLFVKTRSATNTNEKIYFIKSKCVCFITAKGYPIDSLCF